jgi:hypothetical protein
MIDLRQAVVDGLRELSDIDLQRRSWVEGLGGRLPSPVELVCQLFDDSGLGDLLDIGRVFSVESDGALKELGRRVSLVNMDQPLDDLLEDPDWHRVVKKAKEALLNLEGYRGGGA